MRLARWVVLAAIALAPVCARADARLQTECSFGISLRGPVAPMLGLRVGVGFDDVLVVSLRGQLALGASAVTPPCPRDVACGSAAGYRAYSLFPEVRVSTKPWVVQGDFGIGAGVGELSSIPLGRGNDSTDGIAFVEQVSAGLRCNLPVARLFVRAEGAVVLYNGVNGPDVSSTSGLLPVWQVLSSIGYDGLSL